MIPAPASASASAATPSQLKEETVASVLSVGPSAKKVESTSQLLSKEQIATSVTLQSITPTTTEEMTIRTR